MKIVVMCGVGVGTSGILKVNAERALERLQLDARVVATDVEGVRSEAADAQVILTSSELVGAIGKTNADVIVILNYFDVDELVIKLDDALGS